jgi:hypothetical protein
MKKIAGAITLGAVSAAVLLASPGTSSAATAPPVHDKVKGCAPLARTLHHWWPPLLRAQPVSDPDLELYPWQPAASAIGSYISDPAVGQWLPQWIAEAAGAVSTLGIRVGPYPEVPQAVHNGAVRDLAQAFGHMHYWCPASIPARWVTPK